MQLLSQLPSSERQLTITRPGIRFAQRLAYRALVEKRHVGFPAFDCLLRTFSKSCLLNQSLLVSWYEALGLFESSSIVTAITVYGTRLCRNALFISAWLSASECLSKAWVWTCLVGDAREINGVLQYCNCAVSLSFFFFKLWYFYVR